MRIGYPCINLSIDCKSNRTFRLKSYSENRLKETITNNLECLSQILKFNVSHNILFFRITSDLIPFASHPVNKFDWQSYYREKLNEIGTFIRNNGIRVSMHPDQFVLINAKDEGIIKRSIDELKYHTDVLDLMKLDETAKIQIHVGGVYENRWKSIERFIENFDQLKKNLKKRLVIENDDTRYCVKDCIEISKRTGIPVVLDVFHHELYNCKESLLEALELVMKTWKESDGLPIVDYSSQQKGGKKGRHAQSIETNYFRKFLAMTYPYNFDIMLEIKDKEKSVLKALEVKQSMHKYAPSKGG